MSNILHTNTDKLSSIPSHFPAQRRGLELERRHDVQPGDGGHHGHRGLRRQRARLALHRQRQRRASQRVSNEFQSQSGAALAILTIQSNRRSQSALLAVNKNMGGGNGRRKWPKGKDFLFATWAFVIGKISQGFLENGVCK